MFDSQNYASFVAAIVVFQLLPGPGTLAILNATASGGIGAGIGAVAGRSSALGRGWRSTAGKSARSPGDGA